MAKTNPRPVCKDTYPLQKLLSQQKPKHILCQALDSNGKEYISLQKTDCRECTQISQRHLQCKLPNHTSIFYCGPTSVYPRQHFNVTLYLLKVSCCEISSDKSTVHKRQTISKDCVFTSTVRHHI